MFGVDVAEYYRPSLDHHQIIQDLTSVGFINNGGNHPGANKQTPPDLHTRIEFDTITGFIKDCLEDYRKEFQYDCDGFGITKMWANCDKAGAGVHQPLHRHYMCFVSGVYYLTAGAPLFFKDPLNLRVDAPMKVNRLNDSPIRLYPAQPGFLILFPSWVEHATQPHKDNWDRWTIAFNAMPTGEINAKTSGSGLPMANIAVL